MSSTKTKTEFGEEGHLLPFNKNTSAERYENEKNRFASGEIAVGRGAGRVGYVTNVDIVGRRILRKSGEKVHFCVRCNFPIAVYGRLVACLHAFCLTCAHAEPTCFLCESEVVEVERREKLFICGAPGCLLSFEDKKHLLMHIRACHRKLSPSFQLELQQKKKEEMAEKARHLPLQESISNHESQIHPVHSFPRLEPVSDPSKTPPVERNPLPVDEDRRNSSSGFQPHNNPQNYASDYQQNYANWNSETNYAYYESAGQENYYQSGNYYASNLNMNVDNSEPMAQPWSGYANEYDHVIVPTGSDNQTSQYGYNHGGAYDQNTNAYSNNINNNNSNSNNSNQFQDNSFGIGSKTGVEEQSDSMGAWRDGNFQNYYGQNSNYGWS